MCAAAALQSAQEPRKLNSGAHQFLWSWSIPSAPRELLRVPSLLYTVSICCAKAIQLALSFLSGGSALIIGVHSMRSWASFSLHTMNGEIGNLYQCLSTGGDFSPGDIWQWLKVFLFVQTGRVLLKSTG